MVENGLEKKRDVGALVPPLPTPLPTPAPLLFRVIGGTYALLLLVLVAACPVDEFAVV